MNKVLRVAAAQIKFRPTIAGNLERIIAFIAEAARRKSDVVLFPECAVTGYNVDFRSLDFGEVEAGLAAIADAARTNNCNVLVGSPTMLGKKRSNSLLVFNRRG